MSTLSSASARGPILNTMVLATTMNSRSLSFATIQVFLYLQVLDVLTTLLGFRAGLAEGSPFVRVLLHTGPVMGLVADKAIALAIAVACVWFERFRLIRWANYWYAALVGWNLVVILVRVSH